MAVYPVLFTFRDAISGNGYLAGVTLSGRALMEREEDDKWWVYGVRPGAIAQVGATPNEAFLLFRNRYKEVLFDVAEESVDFDGFRAEVERFYHQPDEEEEKRWTESVAAVRAGELVPEAPFSELPREAPENRPTQISIERLDESASARFTPSDNIPDLFTAAA